MSGPSSPAARLLPGPAPLLFAAHGGRINTIATGFGSSGGKTAFKGRRPFMFGAVSPLALSFVFANHHAQNSIAAPEVDGVAPIVYRQAAMRFASGFSLVTIGGSGCTVPLASDAAPYAFSDLIWPRDCGLSAFPPLGLFEFAGAGTYGATSCPVNGSTNRPGGGQSMRYAPANEGTLDIYGNSQTPLTYPSGYDSIPVPMPIAVVGFMPSGAQAVICTLGDSLMFGTGDYQGFGPLGGGVFVRAGYLAGIPGFNGGVSGQGGIHYLTQHKRRAPLDAFATLDVMMLGGNDYFASNAATYAPNGVASLQAACRQRAADFKAASPGGRSIICTMVPRTVAANNTRWSTLADQTPETNFGATGLRTDHNASIRANPADWGADDVFDYATFAQDPSDPTKWKVDAYAGALTAASSAGAASLSLDTPPPVDAMLTLDAGTASVDTAGNGTYATAVSGSASPYSVSTTITDAYSNTTLAYSPALAHAAGAPARVVNTADGIHPAGAVQKPGARALAAAMVRAPRR